MAKIPQQILNSPQFKKLQGDFQKAKAEYRESLTEKFESNAEVQRARTMSRDDIAANAVDIMTGRIKEYNDAKEGKATSEEKAREKARDIARRSGVSDA